MTVEERIDWTVRRVCPINGISVGEYGDSAAIRIDATDAATPEQIAAGEAAALAFDWSAETHAAWEQDRANDAALAPMYTRSPEVDAYRAGLRAAVDLMNIRFELLGVPKILDAEIMPLIRSYIETGVGAPARPDLSPPPPPA